MKETPGTIIQLLFREQESPQNRTVQQHQEYDKRELYSLRTFILPDINIYDIKPFPPIQFISSRSRPRPIN